MSSAWSRLNICTKTLSTYSQNIPEGIFLTNGLYDLTSVVLSSFGKPVCGAIFSFCISLCQDTCCFVQRALGLCLTTCVFSIDRRHKGNRLSPQRAPLHWGRSCWWCSLPWRSSRHGAARSPRLVDLQFLKRALPSTSPRRYQLASAVLFLRSWSAASSHSPCRTSCKTGGPGCIATHFYKSWNSFPAQSVARSTQTCFDEAAGWFKWNHWQLWAALGRVCMGAWGADLKLVWVWKVCFTSTSTLRSNISAFISVGDVEHEFVFPCFPYG